LEVSSNLNREKSLIIDPTNTTTYALGFCTHWYSEIKSKLTNL